ncbi:DUF6247 family protein [Sphaerisporangium fuscum]|uniref:DUF6247 family protein n=1 Tax=Sphaerisporangium fuscum TaxID=2835868 RepID=UPI001BDD9845|nr:DUF6247 family protein [Sphaerisporangium fuscum]
MTAEPLHDDGYDPTEILRALPEAWHEQFLGEYHQALDAAHEVWRFRQLRELLHAWRLRAVAFSTPGFESAAQAVREGRSGEFVPAEQAVPGWAERL